MGLGGVSAAIVHRLMRSCRVIHRSHAGGRPHRRRRALTVRRRLRLLLRAMFLRDAPTLLHRRDVLLSALELDAL